MKEKIMNCPKNDCVVGKPILPAYSSFHICAECYNKLAKAATEEKEHRDTFLLSWVGSHMVEIAASGAAYIVSCASVQGRIVASGRSFREAIENLITEYTFQKELCRND